MRQALSPRRDGAPSAADAEAALEGGAGGASPQVCARGGGEAGGLLSLSQGGGDRQGEGASRADGCGDPPPGALAHGTPRHGRLDLAGLRAAAGCGAAGGEEGGGGERGGGSGGGGADSLVGSRLFFSLGGPPVVAFSARLPPPVSRLHRPLLLSSISSSRPPFPVRLLPNPLPHPTSLGGERSLFPAGVSSQLQL